MPWQSLPAQLSQVSLEAKKRHLSAAMEAISCLPTTHDMVEKTVDALQDYFSNRAVKLVLVSLFDTGKPYGANPTDGSAAERDDRGSGPLDIAARVTNGAPPEVVHAVKAQLAAMLDQDEAVTSWEDYEPTSLDHILHDASGAVSVSSHETPGGAAHFPDWRAVVGAYPGWNKCDVATVAISQGQSVIGFVVIVLSAKSLLELDALVEGARDFCSVAGATLSGALAAYAVSRQLAAEEQLRMQRSFVASVNHELRTPLCEIFPLPPLAPRTAAHPAAHRNSVRSDVHGRRP